MEAGDLGGAIEALTTQLGLRLDLITPADDPAMAELSGHGLRVRIAREGADVSTPLVDGDLPPMAPAFELTRRTEGSTGVGRAGMAYRDLLPSRQGGRFIASHISIPDGGPVPDYVHHHLIRVQVIFCRRGWARLVYQDQGPPFRFEAGDLVLQPPGLRHRVLETSAGFEVVEVSSPAAHATYVDHDLALPTDRTAGRTYGGQRFVHHRASSVAPTPWRSPGFAAEETAVGRATDGLAGVRVVRAVADAASTGPQRHDAELALWYVLGGTATLRVDGRDEAPLGPDDAVAVPGGVVHELVADGQLELLEVTLPERPRVSSP